MYENSQYLGELYVHEKSARWESLWLSTLPISLSKRPFCYSFFFKKKKKTGMHKKIEKEERNLGVFFF